VTLALASMRTAQIVGGRPSPHSDRTRTGSPNPLSCGGLQTVNGSATREPEPGQVAE
jgi:hypothetical protein